VATESLSFDVFANDRASATFRRLGLAADDAAGNVRQLGDRLDKLGTRVSTARVGLDGDKEASAELDKLDVKLIRLGKKVANPNIDVEGQAKAIADISAIDLALDKLDGRTATVTVDVDRHKGIFSRLGGLLGGGAGGAGGAAGAGGLGGLIRGIPGAAGAAPPALQAAGIGGLVGLGAVLTPALLPVLLGGGVGAGAGAGAFALGSSANKQLQALQKQLASAKPGQRGDIRGQIAALRKQSGPELSIFGAFQDLGGVLKDTFAGALKAPGAPAIGPSGRPITGSGAPSFLTGLTGILKQLGGFVKSIGPQLAAMFRASLPFLQMFVHFLEQAAKTLLPVFTQMLQQMTPFLPIFAQGLSNIVGGLAGFLKAIGPSGMQASAKIFVFLTKVMAGALVGLGHTINWLTENVPVWVHDIAKWFDWLRHHTATVFDGIRHDIAHYWDMIFQNTIGVVIRLGHNVATQFNSLRHGIATTFDTVRHDIAAVWDTIWRNTVTRVRNGINDVVGWFKGLPGRAIGAIQGLGTMLYNFGHMALTKLWNGLKSVFSSVWSWFKDLPGKLLNAIGIHSPPDWAVQAGKHIMGGLLHGIISRKDELLSRFNAISQAMGGGVQGRFGPPSGPVQEYAKRLLAAYGWGSQWGAFNSLVMGESGWNPLISNPSSGAYGIPQALPGSKMASAGADWRTSPYTQLRWMMGYIAQNYGSAANAYSMWLSRSPHWYGSGLAGGIFNRPTLIGVGERGPEMVSVTPLGRGGGAGTVVNVTVQVGHGTHPVAAAQEIAKVLNQGAALGGVRLRKSILGPV